MPLKIISSIIRHSLVLIRSLYRSCLMYSLRGSNLGTLNAAIPRKLLVSCALR